MSKAFRMDLAANGMFPSIPLEASVLQALPLSLFCSFSSSVVLTFGTRDSFIMGSPVHFMMFTGIPYHYAASQVAQLVKNLPAMHTGEGPKPHPHDSTLGESSREAQSGRRLLGTNGAQLYRV